jgi:hypothetical protein
MAEAIINPYVAYTMPDYCFHRELLSCKLRVVSRYSPPKQNLVLDPAVISKQDLDNSNFLSLSGKRRTCLIEEVSPKSVAKLLTEKRSARVCRMPHTRGTVTDPFKLRGSHGAHGDHRFAPEQLEHFFQDRGSVSQFVGARLAVAQQPEFGIKRMPRKRSPQHKSVARKSKSEQRVPNHRRSRFGKTMWALLRLARAARCDAGKNLLLTREQQPLRGHRDAAEMTAAITERLADQDKPGNPDALDEIRAKLVAPDPRSLLIEIVLLVYLPPWIEDCAVRRLFKQMKKAFDGCH